jgi:hypothetical protein
VRAPADVLEARVPPGTENVKFREHPYLLGCWANKGERCPPWSQSFGSVTSPLDSEVPLTGMQRSRKLGFVRRRR